MNRATGLTVPSLPQDDGKYHIRRMQLSDTWSIAALAATEYFDTALNAFLCPHRHENPDHVTRRFTRMIQGRYFNPRSIGFVAVTSANPHRPIGYAQFIRFGNDAAAQTLISQEFSLWRMLRKWWLKIQAFIVDFFWPDRSVDHKAMSQFMASVQRG